MFTGWKKTTSEKGVFYSTFRHVNAHHSILNNTWHWLLAMWNILYILNFKKLISFFSSVTLLLYKNVKRLYRSLSEPGPYIKRFTIVAAWLPMPSWHFNVGCTFYFQTLLFMYWVSNMTEITSSFDILSYAMFLFILDI